MSDEGINSPHNACMFRAACRQAEAEIARLQPQPCCQELETCMQRCLPLATSWRTKARQLEAERDKARRKYKRAEDYIEKMDAVIDDCGIAKSCINPLEDLKRAITALKKRAEKAEAQLAEPVAWIRYCYDGSCEGPIMDNLIEDVRKKSGEWTPLFAKREEVARLREEIKQYLNEATK